MTRILSRWWFWVVVLFLVIFLYLISNCAQFADIDRGDATPMPNSTIELMVDNFYG